MTIGSIVLEARRVLGDTAGQAWSDERMVDIANRGMRDIARHGNMYRKEYLVELMANRSRYPLPLDVLKITSLYFNGISLPILSKRDRPKAMYASKDQINLGVLEIMPIPTMTTTPHLYSGAIDVGTNTAVSPSSGVASNPVHTLFGVTSGLIVPNDENTKSPYGIVTGISVKGEGTTVHYTATGAGNGVITSMQVTQPALADKGGVHQHLDTFRLMGSFGFPTSVATKDTSVHMFYKSLPPKIVTLDQAFPLSPQWEDLMVDWLVGTALQDDNDAGNQQRATTFIQRYTRNLEAAVADSSTNYNDDPKVVEYSGGIVKRRRRR